MVAGLSANGAVMNERVDRATALEVLGSVVRRLEISGRISALGVAASHVVEDRIDSGLSDIRVLIEVEACVEEARRPDDRFVILLVGAGRPYFHRGREACPPSGSTASDGEISAATSRSDWSDVSVNRAAFFTAVLDVMHQRIDPRREDVRVGQQVRVDVELT